MHLHDLMGWGGPMTHRQYLAWQAWLGMEWNRPSRSDHYLMQLALVTMRANMKHPGRVQMKHLQLEFKEVTRTASKPEGRLDPRKIEKAAAVSKARWFGMLGKSGSRVKNVTPSSEG